MRLGPAGPSLGALEEQVNNTPGMLDIQPFTAAGTCDSFFDVFVEVEFSGQVLHSQSPIFLTETISHKPPEGAEVWENVGTVQLYDNSDNPTGYYIKTIAYEPVGVYCGDALHPHPVGDLSGDCRVNVVDFAMMAEHWLACTAPECD